MADKIKNIKGSLILLLAAFIWGTAFVAQTSGADSVRDVYHLIPAAQWSERFFYCW